MTTAPPPDLKLFRFERLGRLAGLVHATSTRTGGASGPRGTELNVCFTVRDDPANVLENRRRLLGALGLGAVPTASLRQVHGGAVRTVDAAGLARFAASPGKALPEGDALVTAEAGVALMIYTADCVPVLLCDPQAGVVGAAHASWRSTVADITGKTVAAMADLGADPKRVEAGIGPSIGPCCYEVGPEVRAAAVRSVAALGTCFPSRNGRLIFDLWAANRLLLQRAGVPSDHIEVAGDCTACHVDRYFSHRAERAARPGSMAAVICRRE